MRKFFNILLAVALVICFSSAVLAITTPYITDDDKEETIFYNGQEVKPSTLSTIQLEEFYGITAARENAAAMAALDSSSYALSIPNIESLYGDKLDEAIKKDRSDFLGDLAYIIQEQGTGGSSYQDPGQYSPYESSVEIIEYFVERAQELGFELDGVESRIVKVPAPNYVVPPHKRSARQPGQTDAEYWRQGSMFPLYMYVELGHKDLPEVTLNVSHTDPWEDTGSVRGDRGGWVEYGEDGKELPGVFPTPVHVASPNRFWTLGGSHQANVIRDPVTQRWVMIGRGGDDDRGPIVSMLYGLKAIKDSGVPLRRRIRCVWGTTEDATTMFRRESTISPFYGTTSFGDMGWYTHQDEWPIMGTTADSGVVPIMFSQANSSSSISNIILSWTYDANSIGLRFPNVLPYRHEYNGGSAISAANQWGSGSGTWPNFTDGAPTALPAILYNQARESFVYKTYYAGAWSGTSTGQSMLQAVWLVPPAGTSAANITALLNAVNAVKSNTRINWGGWEYPDEKASRPAVQKVPLAGRWDAGIDVMRVNTATGQAVTTGGDAVQIITKGHVTRFWEKEYFSARHIMAEVLSKIIIPTGFNAPWQNEMRKLIAFYPFENFRERKIWNGNTMVGNYLNKKIYSGTLSSFGNFTPTFNTPISGDSSFCGQMSGTNEIWVTKTTGANVNYTNRGRNDENLTRITASINFTFTNAPVPNDDPSYFRAMYDGTLVAPAVRNRLNDLGLTGTVANSANVTGVPYTQPDSDVLLKAMKAYNNYYRRFGIPDPGYSNEIKEDRPDFINGGTYSNSFRLPTSGQTAANLDGRMIALGGWGGRGTLHGWNERVELDGMVDFNKRVARTFVEYATGVPHTWEVSGNGSAALPHKQRLSYAATNSNVPNIYIQEETTARLAIAALYSNNDIARDEVTEILFARKFRMNGLTGSIPAMTLKTSLINADGTAKGSGTVRMFAKIASNNNWVAVGTPAADGTITFDFEPNTSFDMTAATGATSKDVEVSVIALVKTNGYSVPLSAAGEEEEEEEEEAKKTVRKAIEDRIDKRTGCDAGFAILPLLLVPFVVRRRK
ncbi:MAG: hypothetical protein FWF87_00620 [Synergistaceae bacterium]|nr:hypothetical protein [Synergistaceae bacterium]